METKYFRLTLRSSASSFLLYSRSRFWVTGRNSSETCLLYILLKLLCSVFKISYIVKTKYSIMNVKKYKSEYRFGLNELDSIIVQRILINTPQLIKKNLVDMYRNTIRLKILKTICVLKNTMYNFQFFTLNSRLKCSFNYIVFGYKLFTF